MADITTLSAALNDTLSADPVKRSAAEAQLRASLTSSDPDSTALALLRLATGGASENAGGENANTANIAATAPAKNAVGAGAAGGAVAIAAATALRRLLAKIPNRNVSGGGVEAEEVSATAVAEIARSACRAGRTGAVAAALRAAAAARAEAALPVVLDAVSSAGHGAEADGVAAAARAVVRAAPVGDGRAAATANAMLARWVLPLDAAEAAGRAVSGDAAGTSELARARAAFKAARDAKVLAADSIGAACALLAACADAAALCAEAPDAETPDADSALPRTMRRCLKHALWAASHPLSDKDARGAADAAVRSALSIALCPRRAAAYDEGTVSLALETLALAARAGRPAAAEIRKREREIISTVVFPLLRFDAEADAELWNDAPQEFVSRHLTTEWPAPGSGGSAPRAAAMMLAEQLCKVVAATAGAKGKGARGGKKRGGGKKKGGSSGSDTKPSDALKEATSLIDAVVKARRAADGPAVHGAADRRIAAAPSDAEMLAVLFLYGSIGAALQEASGGSWAGKAARSDVLPLVEAAPAALGAGAVLAATAAWATGRISEWLPENTVQRTTTALAAACVAADPTDAEVDARAEDPCADAVEIETRAPLRAAASEALGSVVMERLDADAVAKMLPSLLPTLTGALADEGTAHPAAAALCVLVSSAGETIAPHAASLSRALASAYASWCGAVQPAAGASQWDNGKWGLLVSDAAAAAATAGAAAGEALAALGEIVEVVAVALDVGDDDETENATAVLADVHALLPLFWEIQVDDDRDASWAGTYSPEGTQMLSFALKHAAATGGAVPAGTVDAAARFLASIPHWDADLIVDAAPVAVEALAVGAIREAAAARTFSAGDIDRAAPIAEAVRGAVIAAEDDSDLAGARAGLEIVIAAVGFCGATDGAAVAPSVKAAVRAAYEIHASNASAGTRSGPRFTSIGIHKRVAAILALAAVQHTSVIVDEIKGADIAEWFACVAATLDAMSVPQSKIILAAFLALIETRAIKIDVDVVGKMAKLCVEVAAAENESADHDDEDDDEEEDEDEDDEDGDDDVNGLSDDDDDDDDIDEDDEDALLADYADIAMRLERGEGIDMDEDLSEQSDEEDVDVINYGPVAERNVCKAFAAFWKSSKGEAAYPGAVDADTTASIAALA